MTDLTKLSEDELKFAIASAWVSAGKATAAVGASAELTRRFAALTERISELEQGEGFAKTAAKAAILRSDSAIARAETAEKERDEAYESCRLMEDRVNRLVDQSGRVVGLENALHSCASAAGSPNATNGCRAVIAIVDSALGVRAEETTRCTCPVGSYNPGGPHEPYCALAPEETNG